MLSSRTIRNAAVVIGGALVAVASATFAHTTLRDQATEGITADNAFRIGHACTTAQGAPLPVVAQSVVVPTVNPQLTASDGSAVASLSSVIQQPSLAGLISPIQDRSIFQAQQMKLDSLGNKIGFSSTRGSLTHLFVGRVPFQFAPPRFATASCAKRLLVRIAIADICVREIGRRSLDVGKVNLWIPDDSSLYATEARALRNDHGLGAPATLTINRNLATNPLPQACGAGIDVTVTPSAEDVDRNLSIPGYWE